MENLNKLCRACLKNEESFNYSFLTNVPSTIFKYCTSIEIKEDELLPKNLCDHCYAILMNYYDFKQKCIESQNTLLNKLQIKIELEENSLSSSDIKSEGVQFKDNEEFDLMIVESEQNFESIVKNEMNLQSRKIIKKSDRDKLKKKNRSKDKFKINPSFYTCKFCKKNFKFKDSFDHHLEYHEGITIPKACKSCNKNFLTLKGLIQHNEDAHTHINLKSLTCTTCGKVLKNKRILKIHGKLHKDRTKKHICDICGKAFTNKINLKDHLGIHSENRERKAACELCGKKFFTQKHLKVHQSRAHIDLTQRYVCYICSYPFRQKSNLAKHIIICHEGKKPYKCEICQKSYSKQSTLVEHKRSHSGEKPFQCEYCSKSFISKRRLTDHYKVHTGERPHKCGVCIQTFAQRGTLVRHMKIHDKFAPVLK